MNADLENTLRELGPRYVGVVARLKASCEAEPSGRALRVLRRRKFRPIAAGAIAAMLVAALGVCRMICGGFAVEEQPGSRFRSLNPYTLAFETSREDALAEIRRTQKPDGSWGSDHLTRQNAAALKRFDVSSVACRKALRYLSSRGLKPLSDSEFYSYKTANDRFVRRSL